ncbi:NADPH-dependent assimilatory sulfite reductase hemoprotein subunit [Ostreibacterium oceani]|uniref:NADPH-dependent assimilatory sulfite reductase hemoprotein subunit n=1 Tax=Ostreibacterium oceani TaxID=2654998 RepID=A0A6N7EV85_9GAMM|nr:NADPH-dependent assimilatory sulfite reductase hemoprotein subunit [Ostreibacterium oceani]MPV86372.1 NADPH-dependent assimilatory sulfite reductase hemoprotein subunit [Ostreibacterium oceani]
MKESKIEIIKRESLGLRGNIANELANDRDQFDSATCDLLKTHGIYQQDDRDSRQEKARQGKNREFSLMIRGRIPGGRLSASQYLAWDAVANRFAKDQSLRVTTRQSLQLHGVLKRELKQTIAEINAVLITTQGACGDVVRNVTQAENPWQDPRISQLDRFVVALSNHFLAKTNAYHEIWLNKKQVLNEQVVNGQVVNGQTKDADNETFYGDTYLPRKFKIAMTVVGNNSVDIYSNDMGFAATFDDGNQLDGFFLFVGGGMGMTHNKVETFPRVADCLGWFSVTNLIAVAEAVVAIHRDFGDRANRKHARLKYVIAEKGIDWMRGQVEARSQTQLLDLPLPTWKSPSVLGWHLMPDGYWAYGLHLTAGRIIDCQSRRLKSAIAALVAEYTLDIQLCADQNILLLGIRDKAAAQSILEYFGVRESQITALDQRALACVALPTCGLALNEGERVLPKYLSLINAQLEKYGLSARAPVFRMTGCANGCARPYTAEIALVGRSKQTYSLFGGGCAEGTKLAALLVDNLDENQIITALDKLFYCWRQQSNESERLGDFIRRLGFEQIRAQLIDAQQTEKNKKTKTRRRRNE